MKNVKLTIIALISMFAIFPLFTHAITTDTGIELSEEEYNNFLKMHTHEYIMTMTQKDYEKLSNIDYSNIISETKYYETTYNPSLKLTTEKEITEEEYENFHSISPILNSDGTSIETTAKKLNMVLAGATNWNFVTVTTTWKSIPATRSFDVIGSRGIGLEYREGSQEGAQIYTTGGSIKRVSYAWNGTNIKKFDNGFGISMNIVNDNITSLQAEIDFDVASTIAHPTVLASYQHAVAEVSLANSQNYTLEGGLGNVFTYPYSISQKYDGMSGVALYY